MLLFWQQGYEATSTRQLVETLGINRNSMYTEFGSKLDFFNAVLEHYEATQLAPNLEPLEVDGADLPEIVALFEHYASIASGPDRGRGCMLANTTVEMGWVAGNTQAVTAAFVTRATAAFRHAMAPAADRAGMSSDDLDQQANYMTSVWLGVLVLLRSDASAGAVDSVAGGAAAHLAGTFPTS